MLSQNSTFRFPKRSQESVTVPLACCCNTPFSEWSRGWASSALPLRPAWYSSPHLRRQIGPPHGRWKFYWIHFWKFLCQRMRLRSFWNVLTPLWSWRGLKHLATDPSWQVPCHTSTFSLVGRSKLPSRMVTVVPRSVDSTRTFSFWLFCGTLTGNVSHNSDAGKFTSRI